MRKTPASVADERDPEIHQVEKKQLRKPWRMVGHRGSQATLFRKEG